MNGVDRTTPALTTSRGAAEWASDGPPVPEGVTGSFDGACLGRTFRRRPGGPGARAPILEPGVRVGLRAEGRAAAAAAGGWSPWLPRAGHGPARGARRCGRPRRRRRGCYPGPETRTRWTSPSPGRFRPWSGTRAPRGETCSGSTFPALGLRGAGTRGRDDEPGQSHRGRARAWLPGGAGAPCRVAVGEAHRDRRRRRPWPAGRGGARNRPWPGDRHPAGGGGGIHRAKQSYVRDSRLPIVDVAADRFSRRSRWTATPPRAAGRSSSETREALFSSRIRVVDHVISDTPTSRAVHA